MVALLRATTNLSNLVPLTEYSCCVDDISDEDFPDELNLGSSRSSTVSEFDQERVETNEHVFTTGDGGLLIIIALMCLFH